MPPKPEETICSISALATQLGNQISVHMLNYLSTTKDLPDGFRELSHTFLDTCRMLWAIEAGVTELAAANRSLPDVIIEEVEKKFVSTYRDFQQLDKIILKLVQYEHRGTLGKIQRGWHRPSHELHRIHESLKKTTETLQISGMAFHWSLGDAHPEESVGIGYAGLAAALDRVSKGRSVMGINKAKSFEPERSASTQSQAHDSRRSTPSGPPKESFTASRFNQSIRPDNQSIADDMSSILSLNGFLDYQPREAEKMPYFDHLALPRRLDKPNSTTSAEEISIRNDSYSDHDAASAKLAQSIFAHSINLKDETRDGTTILIEAIRKRATQQAIETLLNSGCDPNRKDDHGKTALCEAVQSDQPSIVTALLNKDANPNLPGPEHVLWSAIHRPGCLRILLARGADIKKTPGLMEQATSINNIDAVRILLQAGMDPNSKKDGIYTSLCTAIRDDRPDILALLLHHGADPNLMASEYPAWKCITHKRINLLPDLVTAGANLRDPPGIVECAVQENYAEALLWLVNQGGANPNDRNEHGHTAITTAIRKNRLEILEMLLANGADPNLRGKDWPVYMATQSPNMLRLILPKITDLSAHKGVVEKAVQANQLESVKLLIAAGANVEWKNGGVFSPLTTALRENYCALVRYLLDQAGADPNAPGEHLPLVKAIRRCDDGDFAMIELLLERGADPNKCYRDWNAIMQAIEDRDLRLLRLLIEKGGLVDLTQKDETGTTVLDMANSFGWLEGADVLLKNARQ
ncbi:ankyrin repeat-containing domain protein [Penicillium digitatum]|uniref:Uncharacterized protein n=3 Tax=Penicillium digitatum TaxID=36651 RepID=K9GVD4_PEND2|nr:hypothetical protein PDIP_37100 [Penicillium digitatum Pd1]EKV16377.1 hypothetical protein PDIP_37100 [Penicillium digitatum Pd1]EKV18593.1 hypothetical protein PDIG_09070 [Penicillium digitatum PHI26]KAG0158232.1 hypothetical protein PDIDSM_5745 [Penicillium digitatum]QQK42486.1 ankyrin repeat-containing domain protein [Penicillium digitatum]